jgi:hypothetical protein
MVQVNRPSCAHINHNDLMVDVLTFYLHRRSEECLTKHINNCGERKIFTYVRHAINHLPLTFVSPCHILHCYPYHDILRATDNEKWEIVC